MTRNAATPCWDPSTLPTWDPSMSDPIEESDVTDATPITRKARVGAYVRTPCAHAVITWEYGRIVGWNADGDPIVRMASEYEDVLDASEVFKADKAEYADASARWHASCML